MLLAPNLWIVVYYKKSKQILGLYDNWEMFETVSMAQTPQHLFLNRLEQGQT